MSDSPRDRFLTLVRTAIEDGSLQKLTLGKYRGSDATLRNLFVRPITLKTGLHLTFLWRHATRDVTKNHPPTEALAELSSLIGADFLDAHLFTSSATSQLECQPDGTSRLRTKAMVGTAASTAKPATHDRAKVHLIPLHAPWLSALGVTNERGQPREGMADKFRQIQKFAELLSHLLDDLSGPEKASAPSAATIEHTSATAPSALSAPTAVAAPLRVADMGCGKGYLTFAVAHLLRHRAKIVGVEARPELVEFCNRIAREQNFSENLSFMAGTIASTDFKQLDVLIALHACDTATDDALASGLAAGAKLLVVSPCCQKELRCQLKAPPVLSEALRHGIFQERQAEFVTDSLRAQLLEWAGYRTKVFEFIATEHTAKNLMITAIKAHAPGDPVRAAHIREFAAFYGIRRHQLATHLNFPLSGN